MLHSRRRVTFIHLVFLETSGFLLVLRQCYTERRFVCYTASLEDCHQNGVIKCSGLERKYSSSVLSSSLRMERKDLMIDLFRPPYTHPDSLVSPTQAGDTHAFVEHVEKVRPRESNHEKLSLAVGNESC